MTHQFNPTILREYDIRGIVGDTLTEADAYALGRTYAALRMTKARGAIAVGRDGRTHRPMLEAALVRGLTEGGMDVDADRHGALADALFRHALSRCRRRHPGHRQPQPGRLQRLQDAAQRPLGLRRRRSRRSASAPRLGRLERGQRHVEEVDIREAYVDRLLRGFLGQAVPHRLGRRQRRGRARSSRCWSSGCRGSIHAIFSEVDGTFPTTIPTRRSRRTSRTSSASSRDKQLDFGIAFDGDGDRIGAVDGKGRVIWGDQLLMIFAEPVLKEQPGATIIADVKARQRCSTASPSSAASR